MLKLKEFIQRSKVFINENPQRKKLLLIIFILAIIPITVIAALTAQNLIQKASISEVVRISDQGGNTLTSTSDPNVFIDINLNAATNWVLPQSSGNTMNKSLVGKAYAQTNQCSPPYQGFLGCFSSSDHPSGSVCTSSCTTDDGQIGEWCYTSTRVGSSCTNSAGQNGVCNDQGVCVASTVSTPTPPVSTPTSLPQSTANCGTETCDFSWQTCVGPSGTCLRKNVGQNGSYCGTPSKTTNNEACSSEYCDSSLHCANQSQAITPIPATPTVVITLPTSGISPTSGPTPTPTPNILRAIYIENKDTDGSTGGSAPIKIMVNSEADIAHTPWKLNDLLPGQTQAPRIVQVTLIGDNLAVPFATTVNLVRPNGPTNILSRVDVSFDCPRQVLIGRECHGSALAYDTANAPMYKDIVYSWGISSSNSIGTLNKTSGNITSFYVQNIGIGTIWVIAQQGNIQMQKSFDIQVARSVDLIPISTTNNIPQPINVNYDLNNDGAVNCKDMKILVSQYGQKGANLSADFNHDGIVDGIDYNTIVRNYTPGDTTVCTQ